MIVKIKDMKKSYKSTEVLKNINLDVDYGEIISIIGPSGSGKSTLLRCINGLEHTSAGIIEVLGYNISQKRENLPTIYQKVGMVFQHFNLFPHMKVIDNITYAPRHVKRVPKQEAEKEARKLLKMVGLEDKADVYPITLSGGQQQRIAIARALAMEPRMLLFDEPTSALDPEMVTEVLEVIKNLAKTGITMLIVTHEMAFAREVSSRILFLDGGYIVEDEKPEIFFTDPKTERAKEFIAKML